VAGETKVCIMYDRDTCILREVIGHNFVSGLRALKRKNNRKPKKPKQKPKTLKTFYKNLVFSALVWSESRQPHGAVLHLSAEPAELSQRLNRDDSTVIGLVRFNVPLDT